MRICCRMMDRMIIPQQNPQPHRIEVTMPVAPAASDDAKAKPEPTNITISTMKATMARMIMGMDARMPMPNSVQKRLAPARQALPKLVSPDSSTCCTPAIRPPRAMTDTTQMAMPMIKARQISPMMTATRPGGI